MLTKDHPLCHFLRDARFHAGIAARHTNTVGKKNVALRRAGARLSQAQAANHHDRRCERPGHEVSGTGLGRQPELSLADGNTLAAALIPSPHLAYGWHLSVALPEQAKQGSNRLSCYCSFN
ncbi:MAG: hypothetical protein IPG23_11630 [Burkholderiales bacterium]|nr:hypothetical protein [Burkholderiales bacterium]